MRVCDSIKKISLSEALICRSLITFSTFTLLAVNGCLQPIDRSGGGGSFLGTLVLLLVIALLVPLFKAFQAAKETEKFKALVFVVTFYEWFGWVLCITIIGIPFGLGLVLASQAVRLLIEIEKQTRKTNSMLADTLGGIAANLNELTGKTGTR